MNKMMQDMGRALYSDERRLVIKSIFMDLKEVHLKEFIDTQHEILKPKLDFPYSKATATIVIHIAKFFRPCFQEVFTATFITPCPDFEMFTKYALSLCKLFLSKDFPCLSHKTGPVDIHFVRFLMVCALLVELLHYCLQKDCYMYIETIPKCMMVAYDRWLENKIRGIGGFSGLIEFCDNVKPIYDSLPCVAASKVMGLHELSWEVKEIKTSIKDCINNYSMVQISLSVREKQLLSQDQENIDNNTGSCVVCRCRCKYNFFTSLCVKENGDNSPTRSSEEDI